MFTLSCFRVAYFHDLNHEQFFEMEVTKTVPSVRSL